MPLNKLNKGEINELRLARSPKERPVSLFKSGNILKPRDLRSLEKGSLTCGWSHQVNFKESKAAQQDVCVPCSFCAWA